MVDPEMKAADAQRASVHFAAAGQALGSAEMSAAISQNEADDWPPVSFAENDHILVWWLPEYDEVLRQLVDEYQWAWRSAVFPRLETLIPEPVLRAWRDVDPQCHEYSWYNVLANFTAARAKQLGIFPRRAAAHGVLVLLARVPRISPAVRLHHPLGGKPARRVREVSQPGAVCEGLATLTPETVDRSTANTVGRAAASTQGL